MVEEQMSLIDFSFCQNILDILFGMLGIYEI